MQQTQIIAGVFGLLIGLGVLWVITHGEEDDSGSTAKHITHSVVGSIALNATDPGAAVTGFDRSHPSMASDPLRLAENIQQHAIFDVKATGSSGMQWDMTWRLPRCDDGAFFFTAEYDQGLMVALGRTMTDLAGGYIIHLRAPDKEQPGMYNYGISSLQDFWNMRVFYQEELGECPPLTTQMYWVRYQPEGRFTLGWGNRIGERVIFTTKYPYRTTLHNRPVKGIKFVGFGTSSPSCQGLRRIASVGIVTSNLI